MHLLHNVIIRKIYRNVDCILLILTVATSFLRIFSLIVTTLAIFILNL